MRTGLGAKPRATPTLFNLSPGLQRSLKITEIANLKTAWLKNFAYLQRWFSRSFQRQTELDLGTNGHATLRFRRLEHCVSELRCRRLLKKMMLSNITVRTNTADLKYLFSKRQLTTSTTGADLQCLAIK